MKNCGILGGGSRLQYLKSSKVCMSRNNSLHPDGLPNLTLRTSKKLAVMRKMDTVPRWMFLRHTVGSR